MREEQSQVLEAQHRTQLAAQLRATGMKLAFVFCDTAPLLTAIYSDFIFGDKSLYPLARDIHLNYSLTLLLEPDIAWVADGLQRDGAQVRQPITRMIERELCSMSGAFCTIQGHGNERVAAAIEAVARIQPRIDLSG
jgi:nicotinamide riboside kinase